MKSISLTNGNPRGHPALSRSQDIGDAQGIIVSWGAEAPILEIVGGEEAAIRNRNQAPLVNMGDEAPGKLRVLSRVATRGQFDRMKGVMDTRTNMSPPSILGS
jgi:hypothetical protein